MAYVRVTWEYGSINYIRGFRIYADDLLRGTVTTDQREYIDLVDDLVGDVRRAIYEVRAYDEFGRESAGCAVAQVELTSTLHPYMTANSEPANLAEVYTNNCQYKQSAHLPWAWSGSSSRSFDRNGRVDGYWSATFKYTFDEPVQPMRVGIKWSFDTCCGEFNTGSKLTYTFYAVDDEGTREYLTDFLWELENLPGQNMKTLKDVVTSNPTRRFEIEVTPNTIAHHTPSFFGNFVYFYLEGIGFEV